MGVEVDLSLWNESESCISFLNPVRDAASSTARRMPDSTKMRIFDISLNPSPISPFSPGSASSHLTPRLNKV